MTTYTLDTQQARKADQRGGAITECGPYIGRFTRAEDITAGTGAKGIGFSFVANDGRRARFDVWTVKSSGERIPSGNAYVMALMTCLQLRGIEPKPAKVKKWDWDASAEVEVTVPCYTELMDADVGVLLETEDYAKSDGSTGMRVVLAGVFQPKSLLMASEILDRKVQGEQYAKVVATLRHRPLRPQRGATTARQAQPASGGATRHTSFDDMDDDIPF